MTKHILIADDDADDRMFLKEAFEEAGIDLKISFAHDGLEVLSVLSNAPYVPLFIMLDINMPRKNGIDVLAELKTSADYRKIPIIIFTTSKAQEHIKQCYQLGANTFITKPGSFKMLVAVTKNIANYWLKTAELPQN